MNFMEILRTAIFALRGNWMRSALTSLGVIIGIAAVITMVGLPSQFLGSWFTAAFSPVSRSSACPM